MNVVLRIPIINLYNNFENFRFNYNLNNLDKFGELVELLRNRKKLNLDQNYQDALKLEAVFQLISEERLFEFKTISRSTGTQRTLKNKFLESGYKV